MVMLSIAMICDHGMIDRTKHDAVMRLPQQVKQAKEVLQTGEKKIYDWKDNRASCGWYSFGSAENKNTEVNEI